MAEELKWQKRQSVTLTCPSGVKCQVRRPGPDVALRGGRLLELISKTKTDETPEAVMKAVEQLKDDDFNTFMIFARRVVIATLVRPRLVERPSPGNEDEIGPDDLPFGDFWFIFNYGMSGAPGIPVETKDGETSIEDVTNFPEQRTADTDPGDGSGAVQLPAV